MKQSLYLLFRQAEVILRQILHQEGGSDDKWTAAQCLAYYGECDSSVVGELIKQLLEADDLMRHEQAATLLSTLSEGSVSISFRFSLFQFLFFPLSGFLFLFFQ